ncbi:MAG TPA: hypothetical protein VFS33_08880 [Gemmatimonadales bacterium]|nr:hypothetical protein [Gemmatimonadales bacterium]
MAAPRPAARLVVRWTIGDVSGYGFEALHLSTWGARRVFGPHARYVVCVNSVPLARARAQVGPVPAEVEWLDVSQDLCPVIARAIDTGMAEGVGWKFAPIRVDPDRYELHLDNDCVLWALPNAIAHWLADTEPTCLLAEDVITLLGQFQARCGPAPRNSGIRGVPPGFDLAGAFAAALELTGVTLRSELDEQGLVTFACSRDRAPHVVREDDVAICGPFPPHHQHLGRCGAHFVGLNAHRLPWSYAGLSGEAHVRQHWMQLRPQLYRAVGLGPRRR